eukprot:3601688-Prymnesium_polylepis.2
MRCEEVWMRSGRRRQLQQRRDVGAGKARGRESGQGRGRESGQSIFGRSLCPATMKGAQGHAISQQRACRARALFTHAPGSSPIHTRAWLEPYSHAP